MRTYSFKTGEVEKRWYLIDAKGKTLGRLASQIAKILRGKHKPEFTPHADVGDFVVVINAAEVRLTGKKLNQKMYYKYSGYPGGLKEFTAKQMFERHPEYVLYHAVRGMMPKNRLARKQMKKLRIYPGPEYPHQAQKPEPLEIDI